MRDKKKSEAKKSPEQEALEKHVDAMMDPEKTATTAPQLSPKLRKQIAVAEAPAKPLFIDKLDELTESIEASKAPEPTETDKPPEPPSDEDITSQSVDLDDSRTDEAVQDIVAYEGDVVLAVADSTAEEHNREAGVSYEPEKRHVFSTLFWILVAIVAILVIGVCILLVMGDSLTSKLGV